MTQKEVCQGICSQAVISKIENGKISTTIELMQQLANRLNVPLSRLFDRDAQEIAFRNEDRKLTDLFRNQLYDKVILRTKKIITKSIETDLHLLAQYFNLVALEGKKTIDYRTCISALLRITEQEDIWYESPIMYIRIKMAIANYYYLNHQFVHSRKVYTQLLQMDFNTDALKKLRIKILYNHAQQLFFQGEYTEGMKITEKGIKVSLSLLDTSFLGHFYYQRASFNEKLDVDLHQISHDYTLAYTFFMAVDLLNYVKVVKSGKEQYLLFTF